MNTCEKCGDSCEETVSVDSMYYQDICSDCEAELARIEDKCEPEINPDR